MQRVPVVSSNLVSVGYDDERMILEIEFKQNHVYQYKDVPKFHFEAIMEPTQSKGRYLHAHIKGVYAYEVM